MKKLPLIVLLVGLLGAASVQAEIFRPKTVQGAVIGGAVGAVIGHNDGRHTAEGAAIGVAAGAIIGSVVDSRHRPTAPAVVVGSARPCPPPRVVYAPPPRVVVVPGYPAYHRRPVVVRDCGPTTVIVRRPARRVVYVNPAPRCDSRPRHVVVSPRRW